VTRARYALLGMAIVAVYLAAVALTGATRHDDARPLYDGFTPPPTYRFVDPPPFFASGNVAPRDLATSIALGPDGSDAAGFATPDGQFVVSLAPGAIAAAPGATTVAVRVTPLAPRHLAPVPGGLRANGNAYRVDMMYQPSGVNITHFAKAGTLLLEIPEIGKDLFVSADATTWSPQAARAIPPRELSLSTTFAAPGYFLAATGLPALAAQPGRSTNTAVVLGIATAVGAMVVFGAAYIVVRRRRTRI
jgi:hypothetical protein